GDFIRKIRGFVTGNKGPSSWQPSSTHDLKYGVGFLALLILIGWFLSGLFIVNPAEEAVVLRLGQFQAVLQPGLHWIARFIDTKYLVDVQKISSFSLQGDFLTKSSDQSDVSSQYVSLVTG